MYYSCVQILIVQYDVKSNPGSTGKNVVQQYTRVFVIITARSQETKAPLSVTKWFQPEQNSLSARSRCTAGQKFDVGAEV